jgi:hypothetical protein
MFSNNSKCFTINNREHLLINQRRRGYIFRLIVKVKIFNQYHNKRKLFRSSINSEHSSFQTDNKCYHQIVLQSIAYKIKSRSDKKSSCFHYSANRSSLKEIHTRERLIADSPKESLIKLQRGFGALLSVRVVASQGKKVSSLVVGTLCHIIQGGEYDSLHLVINPILYHLVISLVLFVCSYLFIWLPHILSFCFVIVTSFVILMLS